MGPEQGRAYEAEMLRQVGTAGTPGVVDGRSIGYVGPAPVPTPLGGVPIQTAEARINDLSKQTAECAQRLAQARAQHRASTVGLRECHEQFVAVSEMLAQAIHEHREGTPEGVPYQP